MDDQKFEQTSNPFSVFTEKRSARRRNLMSAAIGFTLAATLLVVVTGTEKLRQNAKLNSILASFSQQPPSKKIQQLDHLRQAGTLGLQGIATSVLDQDATVAEHATKLIRSEAATWNSLPIEKQLANALAVAQGLDQASAESQHCECSIEDSLNECSHSLGMDRSKSLAHTLTVQAIEFRKRCQSDAQQQQCQQVLQHLSQLLNENRPAASVTTESVPQRIQPTTPLPIDNLAGAGANWTDWPPPKLIDRGVLQSIPAGDQAGVLGQVTTATTANNPTTLQQQTIHVPTVSASDIIDLKQNPPQTTAAWIEQLRSPSRLVRMYAANTLGRHHIDEPAVLTAMQQQLAVESDALVADRLRSHLPQQ
ncbi:MAG: hypothetical protein CBB71_15805 [Rhodopirellula sp. TMED11]|nr:MAG: hypothetical protein CBB71_15805 [Rhodopirellula sp. TMED11]